MSKLSSFPQYENMQPKPDKSLVKVAATVNGQNVNILASSLGSPAMQTLDTSSSDPVSGQALDFIRQGLFSIGLTFDRDAEGDSCVVFSGVYSPGDTIYRMDLVKYPSDSSNMPYPLLSINLNQVENVVSKGIVSEDNSLSVHKLSQFNNWSQTGTAATLADMRLAGTDSTSDANVNVPVADIIDAVTYADVSYNTGSGTGGLWLSYSVLNPKFYSAGELTEITVAKRDDNDEETPTYLAVYEQPESGSTDPATWPQLGVSENSVNQKVTAVPTWKFSGVHLSGRTIAICALGSKTGTFNSFARWGVKAFQRTSDDTISYSRGASTVYYVPNATIKMRLTVDDKLQTHKIDSVAHLTKAEHEGLTRLLQEHNITV